MLQKVITSCFYLLFFLTPLIFTSVNNELFEFNKMMFVYALTIIIVGCWILKILNRKSFIFKRTLLDIPLLLFLTSQIFSTIFSIDPHTSIWGYYSRSNGGLLSVISYLLLYWALVSNFDAKYAERFIKASLFGGFLVALYAIPEHFGFSPSCLILTGEVTASCWVQDVQARVFATLGQPNWLAAYLGMLIFPAIAFILTSKKKALITFYFLLITCFYLAFTFTYSRGAMIGVILGLLVFTALWAIPNWRELNKYFKKSLEVKILGSIFIGFILINVFFGSALTQFQLIRQSASPARPGIPSTQEVGVSVGTQLENGGTESGKIRLIVWQGALDIFKHYPLFGSGVETFAYSYYNFRPVSHNLVSEWDFLYNKAHNEYLNYLATTGIIGFTAYIGLILTFIAWSSSKISNIKFQISNLRLKILRSKTNSLDSKSLILISSLLAGYASYLVQNFFGFSVVMIALFFYLFPALAFLITEETKELSSEKFNSLLKNTIFKRPLYSSVISGLIVIIMLALIGILLRYWLADFYFKKGSDYSDSGNPGQAYNNLIHSVSLNINEPLYKSELGFAAASASVALAEDDSTTSARLKEDAIEQTELALKLSPKNVSLWRTAIRTYYQLSSIDKSFEIKAIEALDSTIRLSPTDPKLYYNKALILGQDNQLDQGVIELKKAIGLKSNYREAYFTLGIFYEQSQDYTKAREAFEAVTKLVPGDTDATKKLEELKDKR